MERPGDHLVGLAVKASSSTAADLGSVPTFGVDFFFFFLIGGGGGGGGGGGWG